MTDFPKDISLKAMTTTPKQMELLDSNNSDSDGRLDQWKQVIESHARHIWTSPESIEIWAFHGQDAMQLSESWIEYTFAWVRSLFLQKNSSARVERSFAKYLKRFQQMRSSIQKQMRLVQFTAGTQKYVHLVDPTTSATLLCKEISETISAEKESESLLYYVIRQRADLFSAVRR